MMGFSSLVVAVLIVCLREVAMVEDLSDFPDYKDHPCIRECSEKGQPKVCKYRFKLEHYHVLSKACYKCPFNQSHCFLPHCVPGDGVSRTIKTANRMLPGPGIQVCEGDTIVVEIDNMLGESVTMHWHGILQKGTQHMDGVGFVTQCPIISGTKFTYRFNASAPGTHFWHSHGALQKADGLFGSLIVRRPATFELHDELYDFDLSEHVIFVNEWLTDMAVEMFAIFEHVGNRDYEQRRGSSREYKDSDENRSYFTPRATFTVHPGKRYRFRVISSGFMNCPIQFSVDHHLVMIIAMDGSPVEPFVVDSFYLFSGERFDFVLHADKTDNLRNFWIRVRGMAGCSRKNVSETAILTYEGAPDVLPPETTTWQDADRKGVFLNLWNQSGNGTLVDISRMRSAEPDDDIMTSHPEKKIYLALHFSELNNTKMYNREFYPYNSFEDDQKTWTPQINHISFSFPSSPILSQYDDIPETAFCNENTYTEEQTLCVHRHQVSLGDLVELVFVFESGTLDSIHPMHLHGHKFRVIGRDELKTPVSLGLIKAMDERGELNRTTSRAPFKDTVLVPYGGYTIIRFRADNPGIWLLHCHLEFHFEHGMGMLIQVGTKAQFPKTPTGFPKCGDWNGED